MTKTSVKTADGNTPSSEAIANLKRLCRWLELLRGNWNALYGTGNDPIVINSAYRSPAVNAAVKGAPGSNHLTGCAADIHCRNAEQALRYAALLLDISDILKDDFDELIIEQRSTWWLHFAVRPNGNRRRIGIIR